MVVAELDVFSAGFFPAKAHPPLGVNAYAVLSLTIAFQALEAIAWRAAQVSQIKRPVDHRQLTAGRARNIGRRPFRTEAGEDRGGSLIGEAFDPQERTATQDVLSSATYAATAPSPGKPARAASGSWTRTSATCLPATAPQGLSARQAAMADNVAMARRKDGRPPMP
jgi:hypothetical protein